MKRIGNYSIKVFHKIRKRINFQAVLNNFSNKSLNLGMKLIMKN